MTFCGGRIAAGGLEREGRGRGVDIWSLEGSLDPLRDFLRDFMGVLRRRGGSRKRGEKAIGGLMDCHFWVNQSRGSHLKQLNTTPPP